MLRFLLPVSLAASPLAAEAPKVVTDIAPIQGLVASVMGDLGMPDLLIPPGASPHDHALRPSDARALQNADLIFWIGEALTPGVARKISAIAPDATALSLAEVDGTLHLATRDEVLFGDAHDDHDHEPEEHDAHDHDEHSDHGHEGHDHEDDHDHDHDEDHAENDGHHHDHGGEDPHMWLSPANAKLWLPAIADQLTELDPDNAATYAANAQDAAQAITDATETAQSILSEVKDRPFVVFHDAYGYFEADFGLTVLGAIQLSDASAPSPARLAALRDTLKEEGASCVFAEPQFDPRLIAAVTEGSTLRVAELDPLGSTLQSGADFYPALITDLANRIAGCAQD